VPAGDRCGPTSGYQILMQRFTAASGSRNFTA
jgi:hypothetical protein